ncbi:lytic transglycosylase domain-containing protein [Rummeliibacillus suwonensis]|uniref:lytic transglycosylase domain-containing protein n=1 Tax=Rummeliibacillus suwonensis TaxID=1306154 RepID=UPI0028A27BA6|nr:lytic transglycosylase domain-containing protein [Rummeliibacillus suwonensis]
MNIQSLQTLAQLQSLQGMNSNGTSSLSNSTSSTSDLFAQMLSQLTSSSSTSDASQMLGLTNSLSSDNTSYLLQLLGNSSYSNVLNNDSLSNYSQSLGYKNATSTDYSQLLNGLSNASSSTNNSLYYNGTLPVYIPTSIMNGLNNRYDQTINNLQNPQAGSTKVSSNTNYDAIIKKASETYGIPEKMIKSVIKQESGFNNYATSSAGAGGLMQLMPGTAQYLGVSNVYDAEQNIMGGTKYLKQLYDKFSGNYNLMLAAYNAGPGNVTKYGGIPPFKETENYVTNIMNTYKA